MSQPFLFGVESWAAWSPTLKTSGDWLSWVDSPIAPMGSEKPKVEGMQSMNRRRLKQLGAMALETVFSLPEVEAPIIFCSQQGESTRCCELLQELVETGKLSPQSFSLAVHNAIPSLYTIDRKLNSNVIAISSNSGVFSAITEAIGLFSDGENRVRIIVATEPTSEIYKKYEFTDEAYAYSLDLIPVGNLSLSLATAVGIKHSAGNVSINLDVLRFFLSENPVYEASIDNTLWQLRRL